MKPDPLTIIVSDPRTNAFVTWKSDNKKSLINQARIEVARGAVVEIRNSLGRIIWKG